MTRRLHPADVDESLRAFVEAGILGIAEIHLARTLARVGSPPEHQLSNPELFALAFAAWAVNASHVCLDLADIERQVASATAHRLEQSDGQKFSALPWPNPAQLIEELSASPLVGRPVVDPDGVDLTRPLVLNGSLLYMTRQWIDEGIVARLLTERFLAPASLASLATETWSRAAFAEPDGIDRAQVDAVRAVLARKTVVLLGGPGTGKTYTIAAMLHALAERRTAEGGPELRVALAAPTAKAAQQMTSSISGSISSDSFPSSHTDAIGRWSMSAQTLHSLLGVRNGNLVRFRHDAQSQLRHDVVIIDEVSMVSLPLMARLLEAVPESATLVLVGDPQQLQSIETGAVLGEIERLSSDVSHITVLKENRRQLVKAADGSLTLNAIGRIAALMRPDDADEIDVDAVVSALRAPGDNSLTWIETDDTLEPTVPRVVSTIEPDLAAFIAARIAAESVSSDPGNPDHSREAISKVESVRILCAHRRGPWGVSAWNDVGESVAGVERSLRSPGRPLLVTRNDRSMGLNNGDTGIVVGAVGTRAAFRTQGGIDHEDPSSVREIEMTALADVETAFAMTVHKSQGSQYETVVFVVPPQSSPLLQRELIYTAVTRAKSRLVVVGHSAAIVKALASKSQRRSSLADRVRAGLASPPNK